LGLNAQKGEGLVGFPGDGGNRATVPAIQAVAQVTQRPCWRVRYV